MNTGSGRLRSQLRRLLAAVRPNARRRLEDGAAHTMTGAYACDALAPGDRRAVDAHLRTCTVCTEEVAAFAAVAAQLAEAVALAPPARLYPRVISEITSAR